VGNCLLGPPRRGLGAPLPFRRSCATYSPSTYRRTPQHQIGTCSVLPRAVLFAPRNFRARAWDGAVKAAGVAPLRIHDLRHTTAALLIAQGAHVKEIVERLGHSSPVVT
jgi:integrase